MNLYDEDLSQEKGQVIFVTMFENEVVACALLKLISGEAVKLRQMGVRDDHQGKRLGTNLVQIVESWCVDNGYQMIETHAREYAQDFYLKLGYQIKGDRFTEVGIPHRLMVKQLSSLDETQKCLNQARYNEKIANSSNKCGAHRPACTMCKPNR